MVESSLFPDILKTYQFFTASYKNEKSTNKGSTMYILYIDR